MEALRNYEWKGNVRELLTALRSALSVARNAPTLFHYHLPREIRIRTAQKIIGSDSSPRISNGLVLPEKELGPLSDYRKAMMVKIEKEYFEKLHRVTNGDMAKAMKISGLSRSRLYQLIRDRKISWK